MKIYPFFLIIIAVLRRVLGVFEPYVAVKSPLLTVFLHDRPGSPETTKNFTLEKYFTGFNLSFVVKDLNTNDTITLPKFLESDPNATFAETIAIKGLGMVDQGLDFLIGSLYPNKTLKISQLIEDITFTTVANYTIEGDFEECTDIANSIYGIITINCIDSRGNYTLVSINVSSAHANVTMTPTYSTSSPYQKAFLREFYPTEEYYGGVFLIATYNSGGVCRWRVEIWEYEPSLNIFEVAVGFDEEEFEEVLGYSICLLDLLPIDEDYFILVTTQGHQLLFSMQDGDITLENEFRVNSEKPIARARFIDYNEQLFIFQIAQNVLFQTQLNINSYRPIATSNYTFEAEITIVDCIITQKKLIVEALNQTSSSSLVMIYALETDSEVWRAGDMFYINNITYVRSPVVFPLVENYGPDNRTFYLRLGQRQNWINQILTPKWRLNATALNDPKGEYKRIYAVSALFEKRAELTKDIPIFFFNSSYYQVTEASDQTISSLDLVYPQNYRFDAFNLGFAGPSLVYDINGIPGSFKDYEIIDNLTKIDICWIQTDSLGNIWKLSFDEDQFNLSHCSYNETTLDCDYEFIIENSFNAYPEKLLVNAFPLIAIYVGISGSGIGGLWIGKFENNNNQWNLTDFTVVSQYNFSSSCIDAIIPQESSDFLYCLAWDTTSQGTSIIAYNLTDLRANNFRNFKKIAIESPFLPQGPAFDMLIQMDNYADLILLTNKLTQKVYVYQADFLLTGPRTRSKINYLTTVQTGIHVMNSMSVVFPFVSYRTGVFCLYFETYGIFEEWNIITTTLDEPLTFKRETILYGHTIEEYEGTFPFGRFSFSPHSGNVYLITSQKRKANIMVFIYNLYEPDDCEDEICPSRLPRGVITANETNDFIWGLQVGSAIQLDNFDLIYLWGMQQTLVLAYQDEPYCDIFTGLIDETSADSSMSMQLFNVSISASSIFTPDLKKERQMKLYVYRSMQNITVSPRLVEEAQKINIYKGSFFNYSIFVEDYFQGSVITMEIASSDPRDVSEGNIQFSGKMRTISELQITYELPADEEYSRIVSGKDFLYVIGTKGIYIGSKANLLQNQSSRFSLIQFKTQGVLHQGELVLSKDESRAIFFGQDLPFTSIFDPRTKKIFYDLNGTTVISASIIEDKTAVLLLEPVLQTNGTICNKNVALLIGNPYTFSGGITFSYQDLCSALRLQLSSDTVLVADSFAINVTSTQIYSVFMLVSDPVPREQLFVYCTVHVTDKSVKKYSNCSATSLAALIWDYNATDIYYPWNSIQIINQNTSCTSNNSCRTTFKIYIGNGNYNSYLLSITRVSDVLFETPKILKGFVSYLPQSNITLVNVNENYLLLKIRSDYSNTPTYLSIGEEHLLVYNLSSTEPVLQRPGQYSLYEAMDLSRQSISDYAIGFDTTENLLFQLDRAASEESFGFKVKRISETYELLIKNSSNLTSRRLSLSALNFVSNQTITFELVTVPPKEKSLILFYMFLGIISFLFVILTAYFCCWVGKKLARIRVGKHRGSYRSLL